MVKDLVHKHKIEKSYLIEYDRRNPDPDFTPELIRFIESRQIGLSERDIAKLDEIEFFTLHRFFGALLGCMIPGLRAQPNIGVIYVRRFNTKPYIEMINQFLEYIPPDFPQDQIGRYGLPAYRLTTPDGSQFYPIEFNGDLVAWVKRIRDNAIYIRTLVGVIEQGNFSISDGRNIEFIDINIDRSTGIRYEDNF